MKPPYLRIAGLSILMVLLHSAAAQASPPAVAVLEFSYLDTSGEPRDQGAEHAARLAAQHADLQQALHASGKFRVVAFPSPPDEACRQSSDCLLGKAREAEADLVLTGAVQKISTMATQLWVGMFEVSTGKRIFYRQMNFRGDTDEAWRRASAFLARDLVRSR